MGTGCCQQRPRGGQAGGVGMMGGPTPGVGYGAATVLAGYSLGALTITSTVLAGRDVTS